MRNLKPLRIFVSAERRGQPPSVNERVTSELACDLAALDAIRWVELEGHFDGVHERAFLVVIDNRAQFNESNGYPLGFDPPEAFRELAAEYLQSSVLVVHGDDAAELLDCDDPTRDAFIGRLVPVKAGDLKAHEDYSRLDDSDTFWVVR